MNVIRFQFQTAGPRIPKETNNKKEMIKPRRRKRVKEKE
jgi:hypothetical protein